MELDNVLCILYQFLSSFFLKDRFLSEYRAGKGPILLVAEFVGAEFVRGRVVQYSHRVQHWYWGLPSSLISVNVR